MKKKPSLKITMLMLILLGMSVGILYWVHTKNPDAWKHQQFEWWQISS